MAACAGDAREALQSPESDILMNTSPKVPPGTWQLALDSALTIGASADPADRDTLFQFADIVGAVLLADGRIVVAAAQSGSLRFYSPRGEFLFSAGRPGEGPGEFRQMMSLHRIRGDTLAVDDYKVEVDWFDPNGKVIEGNARRESVIQMGVAAVAEDGSLFGVAMSGYDLAGRFRQRRHTILRMDRWTTQADSVATMPGILEMPHVPGMPPSSIAFYPQLLMAVQGTSLVTAHTSRYALQVRSRDGNVRRQFARDASPEPVSDDLKRRYRRMVLTRRMEDGSPFPVAWARQQEQHFAQDPFPAALPLISRLLAADRGELWVLRYDPERILQPVTSVGPGLYGTESAWDVFDSTGVWQTTVTLPSWHSLLDVRQDALLALVANEDGEQGVRRIPLRRGTR